MKIPFPISSGLMKLKPYSYKQVIVVLNKLGFVVVRHKGSHIIIKGFYNGKNRTVVAPKHGEIAIGTLRSILFQADISIEEFIRLIES
jgi:predicted RNA binding protein YcfA (HicA-like mRNA interferase family)